MANTKPTTPISTARSSLTILGIALALFAVTNLFGSMTPVSDENKRIDLALKNDLALPVAPRLAAFTDLRHFQETALAKRPSEPYGWSRLAYLRLATTGNAKFAFAALRMSDFVSPFEAHQLPERALMWWKLRSIETKDQQAYQDLLWVKAYGMDRDATWDIAAHNGLTNQVGISLQANAPDLFEEWKARASAKP